ALAWAYVRFGTRAGGAAVLYGVKPAVLAIVLAALAALGRTALKSRTAAIAAAGAIVLLAAGVHELIVLALAGALVALARVPQARAPALAAIMPPGLATGAAAAPGAAGLFLVFLKIGAVLYGSGYVLFAFLRTDLVERLHWLTDAQLVDAI